MSTPASQPSPDPENRPSAATPGTTPPPGPEPKTEAASVTIDPVTGKKLWSVGTLTYTSTGIVVLFLWLLWGDFAWSMRDRSVGPMSQWYLDELKVPQYLFALLTVSFPAAIGLILGPIISVKSDRHRGKRGRRIPFLLVTTPIAAFGMLGLAATPFIARWMHNVLGKEHAFGGWIHNLLDGTAGGAWLVDHLQDPMIVSVVCFGVFWAAFEFATIAGQAVFGGLINDVVPKPLLGRFYGLFRAVSLIDGMIFNFWIMGKVPGYFTLILTVIGVFYGVAFMWVCLKVKEGDYPPPPPVPAPKPGHSNNWFARFGREIATYCRECFSNPYYLSVFVLLMCATLAFAPINIYAVRYTKSLGISMDTYGKCLALTYLISLSLSWFLGWMADKFHPLRMAIGFLIGYALVTLWGCFFAKTPNTYLFAWVLHGVLSGCYFTGAASLAMRLFPHSRFAQFASAAGIFGSLANMVFAPALGMMIQGTGTATEQNYRLTWIAGCALSLIALGAAWYVYGKFMKLGGPKNYVAPE
ncbi:MFS transporter [Opitutaceae bacterium TAV5]|nr:MFS transporter [Opitutaceae bacterium TAV5]